MRRLDLFGGAQGRERALAWVLLASAGAMLFFAFTHWHLGCCNTLSWIEVVLSTILLTLFAALRLGAPRARIEDGLAMCALVLFPALLFTETLENTGPYWLAGYPFVIYFIKPVRAARFWVAALLAVLAVVWALLRAGRVEIWMSDVQLACMMAVIAFFWLLAHIYQSLLEARTREVEEANRELDRQHSRLETVLDHAPEGIWMTDPEGRIQLLNRQWARWTGLDEAAAIGEALEAQAPRQVADRLMKLAHKALEAGSPVRDRLVLDCADGEARTLEIVEVPVGMGEAAQGVVGFAIDLTERERHEAERRRLERQVQHAQRLESLGVMAGGIAHDFNNLLTAIQGNVELARFVEDRAELEASLDAIAQAAGAAAGLCQQMLAYSGKGVLRMEPVNVDAFLRDMRALLQSSVTRKVRLELDLAAGDEGWVLADASQLRQVVINAAINASEALEGCADPHIRIATGIESWDAPRQVAAPPGTELGPGRYLRLEIEDNGRGMDEETLEHIFDPFFTTKFTGRGLGMSAVLGIVRAHHGGLRIRSRPGEGTRLTVWLPLTERRAEVEATGAGDRGERLEGTVLLVDDEEEVRRTAARMLQSLGLRVLQAANGEEALALFDRHREEIDWVLLDLTMPVMDGRRCLEALRGRDPDLYVVMSSGFNLEADEAGEASDVLKKPYSLRALREVAARALEARKK